MRKTVLTLFASFVFTAAGHSTSSLAQQAKPAVAFAAYVDLWMARAAMLRMCSKTATAEKAEAMAATFLNKSLGWDMPRAQQHTSSVVARFVGVFKTWQEGANPRNTAIAKRMFSPASCGQIDFLSKFDVGFLRGKLRRMQ